MDSLNHKASVDSDGNIVLPGAQTHREETGMEEGVWYTPRFSVESGTVTEGIAEMPAVFGVNQKIIERVTDVPDPAPLWTVEETTTVVKTNVREQLFSVTHDVVHESVRQFAASAEGGKKFGNDAMKSFRSGFKHAWSFLKQPVWVPGRRNIPKQHSRGVLFVLDTMRFGGTFASLFGLLFVSLNYQSFWAIAQSYVDPLAQVTGVGSSQDSLGKDVAEKLKRIPSLATAGQEDGSLLDFLPPVGPPDDRLIIPKLNINVPIVVPPNAALMQEDWKRLEEDIQAGLQNGVVHYPGTARPGQAGNFFVTGHSSYFPWDPGQYKSVFARLHDLNVGDEYWVFYNGDRYRYVIQEEKEIKPSDVSVLDQPVNKRMSTLMTCTPVGTTLRRLIITAQEVDPVTGLALDVGEHRNEELPKMKMEALPI